jgi:hypothetical protein
MKGELTGFGSILLLSIADAEALAEANIAKTRVVNLCP